MTNGARSQQRSYLVEVHVHGVLYVRVERVPPRLAALLGVIGSLIGTWLLTR
jgi:hypothetical protein